MSEKPAIVRSFNLLLQRSPRRIARLISEGGFASISHGDGWRDGTGPITDELYPLTGPEGIIEVRYHIITCWAARKENPRNLIPNIVTKASAEDYCRQHRLRLPYADEALLAFARDHRLGNEYHEDGVVAFIKDSTKVLIVAGGCTRIARAGQACLNRELWHATAYGAWTVGGYILAVEDS